MRTKPTTAGPAPTDLPRRHDALAILDVDEVVLHFIEPFQRLLNESGARLHFDSFKLTGNVRSIATGTALTGHELDRSTRDLYRDQERRQDVVEGAVVGINALARHADIVLLTAMHPEFYDERRRLLDRSGIPFPMIATERSKGAVVAELRRLWKGPIAFVDDIPPNLAGVRRSAPDVHLIHLMANAEFRAHLPPLPAGAHSARNWTEASELLARLLAPAPTTG